VLASQEAQLSQKGHVRDATSLSHSSHSNLHHCYRFHFQYVSILNRFRDKKRYWLKIASWGKAVPNIFTIFFYNWATSMAYLMV